MVSAHSSRSAVAVCSVILGVMTVGNFYALLHGSGLLLQPHPFLPGTFHLWLWLGLLLECAAFAILVFSKARLFLTVCLGLAVVFVAYHAVQAGLEIPGPCPCLGGFLSHWKPLAQGETLLSFGLACVLGVVAFAGLFPVSAPGSPAPQAQAWARPAAVSMSLWLLFGAAVVWLWQGRVLGGDEGMEAAKALQLALDHGAWSRVWNDQPPLLSFVGALAFKMVAPGIGVGRVVVVLLGLVLPLTLAAYHSQMACRWATPVSVVLLWLATPHAWASFMQEAPAYALALAAWLPLLRRPNDRWALLLSTAIAALALSVKLTAAFGLVAPFVWLLQRSAARALRWGTGAVGLMIVSSWLLPGWSWSTMAVAHLQSGVEAVQKYRLQPSAYAHSWLVCGLALAAVAVSHVRNRLSVIVPWLSAAGVALLIHCVHHPYFRYYDLHLLAPLAVLGGIGFVEVWSWLGTELRFHRARWPAAVGVLAVSGLWAGQRISRSGADRQVAKQWASSPIVEQLASLRKAGETAFSMDPVWTFAAGLVQTPPELTVIPLKRIWSGQANDRFITAMLASNHVGGIVVSQALTQHPEWSNLLSGYAPTGRSGEELVFIRNDLNPKSIDLNEQSRLFHRLGL